MERNRTFFSNVWSNLKNWANNTFGFGSSTTTTIAHYETSIISDPAPITIDTGSKTTQIISEKGDSSKPISFYSNKDTTNPTSSTAGIKLNISDFTLGINFGFDNIGISGTLTDGDSSNCIALKVNLSELKVGIEDSISIKWDGTTTKTYTNVSANGWAIVAVAAFITTGQIIQTPAYIK